MTMGVSDLMISFNVLVNDSAGALFIFITNSSTDSAAISFLTSYFKLSNLKIRTHYIIKMATWYELEILLQDPTLEFYPIALMNR